MLQMMRDFKDLWSAYCGNSTQTTIQLADEKGSAAVFQLFRSFKILPCYKDLFITILDLVFLLIFWVALLVKWRRKSGYMKCLKRQNVLCKFMSIAIVLFGFFQIGLGVWCLNQNWQYVHPLVPIHRWLMLLMHGLAWLSIGYSVALPIKHGSESVFIRLWWILTFALGTMEVVISSLSFMQDSEMPVSSIISFVSWPLCCFMLFCAIKKESESSQDDDIREPLLNGYSNRRVYSRESNGKRVSSKEWNTSLTDFAKAGFISKMTFWWLNPLLSRGRKKLLVEEDLPNVSFEDQARNTYSALAERMLRIEEEKPSDTPSVMWALFYNQRKNLAITGFCAFMKICSLSCGPIVLNAFIKFAEAENPSKMQGYILAGMLFCIKVLESLSQRQWYFGVRRIGLQVRSALVAAVYKKQLKLSHTARQIHTAGEINNYMAVDAYRIGELPFWIHQSWTTIFQLFLALIILFYSIGWATFSVLVVVTLTVLLNSPLAKLQHKFQTQLMMTQDERLRAMSEALSHIKILKLHAWEGRIKKNIEILRAAEFKWLSAVNMRKAYATLLFWSSPVLASPVAFATCYLTGVPLTASNVFTFIATLRLVQDPVRLIPDVIAIIIQAKVSMSRIDNFLNASELQQGLVEHTLSRNPEKSVCIKSATLSWETDNSKPTLSDIELDVKPGMKVAVCGEVGSGKSTLLASVLGEVPKLKGQIQVWGSVAYVSQSAWIQSGTVQDNILFGQTLDEQKYHSVIEKCSLVKDLMSFPFGDQTEIGERGVNLSGGQKQRIQLARALYQDADIYLLDDPFSAVDADTASCLFQGYMMDALSAKTVILITHQVDFLPAFDVILLMMDGQISQLGKYDDMLQSSINFKELVTAHKGSMAVDRSITTPLQPKNKISIQDKGIQKNKNNTQGWTDEKSSKATQLIKREEKEIGNTGFKPYVDYLKQNKGFLYGSLAAFTHLIFVITQVLQNSWMASKVENPDISTTMLITVYTGIGVLGMVCLFFRSVFVVNMGLKASKSFFSQLMTSLIRAPMSFFDSTPLGRVLSRVSSDFSIIDIDLPFSLIYSVAATMNVCSSVSVIASVTWQVLIIVLPMIVIVIQLQKYYLCSAKELMRINGTTKSPIANHLGESISGGMTIRAFKVEEQFIKKNLDLTDKNSTPFFHTFSANEWLIQRLEFLSALVLCSSALTMVSLPLGAFDTGFVGMALSYGLSLNNSLVNSIQNQCQLANYIVSVERLKQYMHIPSEAPDTIEDNRPPLDWPSQGRVELHDLQVRYRTGSPMVLKGITCTIESRHKVGVVGRTGSGKTTLIGAIFRLVEPAGGKIIIDGINTISIGLHDLRSRLGIIPQEPTLFRGTVRFNLDPLSEFSDMAIWEALNKCQLGDIVKEKLTGLDSLVGDDGDNWSVGQRQLFCLGRALLRRSKILVLDEATASIDNTTDAIIQNTIRSEFKDCTIITVAHRIPTVMDSDMVLAISDGEMVEYDKPLNLMERQGSLYGRLVSEYWSHSSNAFILASNRT